MKLECQRSIIKERSNSKGWNLVRKQWQFQIREVLIQLSSFLNVILKHSIILFFLNKWIHIERINSVLTTRSWLRIPFVASVPSFHYLFSSLNSCSHRFPGFPFTVRMNINAFLMTGREPSNVPPKERTITWIPAQFEFRLSLVLIQKAALNQPKIYRHFLPSFLALTFSSRGKLHFHSSPSLLNHYIQVEWDDILFTGNFFFHPQLSYLQKLIA